MTPYWVRFDDGTAVCCEADGPEAAAKIAGTVCGQRVMGLPAILPYPAQPCVGERSACPPFCYTPGACAGLSSCPRDPACSE